MTFSNSSESQNNCKQIVLDFDLKQANQACENNSHSCSDYSADFKPVTHIRISLEPIAESLAIAPDRYWLSHTRGGDRWVIPIQLTAFEGWTLYHQVANEHDRNVILAMAECLIGRGAA